MADELRQAFLVEARELADQLMVGVLQAERGGVLTADQRRHLLRLAHTLKGAARLVKEQAIGDAAHAMEDQIAAAPGQLGRADVTRLLALVDTVTASLPPADAPAVEDTRAAGPAPEDSTRVLRVDLADIEAATERVADLATRLASLQLVLPSSSMQARATVDRLALSVAELRTQLYRMRLAPANSVFVAVERAVRDAAQATDVLVTFTASGGEHRLDADVLEALRDALIQLARNAVAHGIEPPRQRAAAGKPPAGRVELIVERRGAAVAFTVRDDGRGLDVEALRRAAVAHGQGADLGEPELIDLLLAGGLTSRAVATQISGRGVGLDLVRSIVARLRGSLSLRHDEGRGVTVEFVVPASLQSLQYVRLESGAASALLPLHAVRRTLRLAATDVVTLDGRAHVMLDGRALPLLRLQDVLAADMPAPQRVVAIIDTASGVLGIAAERFGEAAETIAQALPPLTAATAVIRDIALDPDGRIVPVLDPRLLHRDLAGVADRAVAPSDARVPLVLVVDDSVTSRMLEQSILEAAGFRVDTAASAEEGLRCAVETPYDLFVVDVEMPGMNGFEFVQATRANDALAKVPAILVTSRATAADRRMGIEAGARGYIVKSEFDQETFLDLVRRFVG